jgi:hypothetical protein
MTYDDEKGVATFSRESYPGSADTYGEELQVKCSLHDAEKIARALKRVYIAG